MQHEIGPLTTMVNGNETGTLRTRTNKKGNFLCTKRNAIYYIPFLTLKNQSVSLPLDIQNNQSQNNGLSTEESASPEIPRQLEYNSYTNNNSKVLKIKQDVTKCLINNTSPTIEKRENLFQKLVKETSATKVVLNLAVVMESSIEEVKDI